MIEAQNLMKHNLVFLLENNKSTPVTVLEILRDGLVVYDKTVYNTKLVKFDEVFPIPLNTGIILNTLKMNMSVLSDNNPNINRKEEVFYSCILDNDNDLLIITNPETEDCIVSIKINNDTNKTIEVKGDLIKTVHQLQNFVNSVVGISLMF